MSSLLSVIAAALLLASRHPSMPKGMSHEEHLKQMKKDEELKKRGAEATGFDQDAVTHHFKLTPSGGSIEVTVKKQRAETVIAAVRSHLRFVAHEFAQGKLRQTIRDARRGGTGCSRDANPSWINLVSLRGPAAGRCRAYRGSGRPRTCGGARIPQVSDQGASDRGPDTISAGVAEHASPR